MIRRSFLFALPALVAAPSIVRATSLMPPAVYRWQRVHWYNVAKDWRPSADPEDFCRITMSGFFASREEAIAALKNPFTYDPCMIVCLAPRISRIITVKS